MCVFTECTSRTWLVGTFLSVSALTLLCGLVVVAMSRLVLRKKGWSPEGTAEDGVYHCSVKVSPQMSSWPVVVISTARGLFKLIET